ncbi:MAG TPA: HEAT repeat domain-containing protein [Allosphingosinicella sp.]|nr:HEAT repeat domain-containing protein [Allosphingosinicella sp.]
MILNDTLAGWLANPAARQATDAAMRVLAGEIAQMPAVLALRQGLPAAAADGAGAVLALARTFMDDDAALASLMAAAIAAAAADAFCRPPFRAVRTDVQQGLLLISSPEMTLQLAALSAEALTLKRSSPHGLVRITFTGERSLFRFLRGGGASLSVFAAPSIEEGFRSGEGCRLRERRRLSDGEVIEIDGRCEAFVIDRAESDLVYLFASTPLDAGPVAVDYDPATLAPVAASSTDDSGSRTQMMLALLRTLERRDAAPLFVPRLRAGHFHTRWQAMRELLALDAEFALPHLRDMAGSDPDTEVRAAAAETLAAFFPGRMEQSCHA